ncbi:unnamed protein product [Symbiodinium natans]|uniref:Tetratricopeptide repeat protein n=1 Tax=Symbiodinium natans TaxID=878477 RepID=A0A812Q3N3_9DINO|nr:unnamed protein product [Symbiodinium natans]
MAVAEALPDRPHRRLRRLVSWTCLVLGAGVSLTGDSGGSGGSGFTLPRRAVGIAHLLVLPKVAEAIEDAGVPGGPTEADVSSMQSALSAVQRIGDFPSKSALATAEQELTQLLSRWRVLAVSANEVPAILRRRAYVHLRGGRLQEALADLDEALRLCEASKTDPIVLYDEMPKVLVSRGNVLRAMQRWDAAVLDYDRAAQLFGEPLEDLELLEGRAKAKVGQAQFLSASEDFEAAAALLRSAGRRPEAEIADERSAVALLGEDLAKAEEGFVGVIRRCVGLMSQDMALLQRVVQADSDARMAMVAISWHKGETEIAETYWRDGCDRLNILAAEAQGKNLALGFANGDIYNCTRYTSDFDWIREAQGWPKEAISWFQDFLQRRPGEAPRDSYLQDLMAGKKPGEGSTLMDLALASDAFRRSDPLADLQKNLKRQPELDRQRQTAERR